DWRAHALRARDTAPRPGRRAAGEGCEDRPRPQPGRPGRDLVRVDPDQPGVRRAAAAAVALLALACCARAADPPGSPRANQPRSASTRASSKHTWVSHALLRRAASGTRRAPRRGVPWSRPSGRTTRPRRPRRGSCSRASPSSEPRRRPPVGMLLAETRRQRALHLAARVLVADGLVAVVGRHARYRERPGARPGPAGVALRAGVAVVAGGAVGLRRVWARAGRGVAGAGGVALVGRGAHDGIRAGARPGLTGVGPGAGVAVVAGGAVGLRRVGARAGRGVAGAGGVA